ncbi:hypothetical protein [Nocardia sp. NPDC059239]|uniref:ATP-dependent DNA ligase n=1 Tax=Nocardia sp. NPDC059239 TaxID=3346785 RepID=UPI0036B8A682
MVRHPVPMLATPGPAPADDDTRYAYECKYDGIRCLAWISDGVCHMISRNGNSLNAAFPEISHALLSLAAGRELTLDGELVAPDRGGVPRFSRIGRRLGVTRPSPALIRAVPACLYVFDLLGFGGRDLRTLTYLERRERLERLGLPHGPVLLSPSYRDIPVSRMLAVAAEHDIEGVIGKRVDSYPDQAAYLFEGRAERHYAECRTLAEGATGHGIPGNRPGHVNVMKTIHRFIAERLRVDIVS